MTRDERQVLEAAPADAEPNWESGTTPSVRAATAAMRLLRDDGYQVLFRHGGFSDCFVVRGDERWVGRGGDDVHALMDVLSHMFPSRVAWQLLGDRVAEPSAAAKSRDELASGPPVATPAIPAAPVAAAPPNAKHATAAKTTVATALDAMAALRKEIDQARAQLGRLAPTRQRLRVQAWMCRARAEQERHAASAELVREVALVARELSTICKVYWPGSVRALQSGTRPSDVAARAVTWAEAAAHAIALDRPEPSSILDADGWADGAKLVPPPAQPELLLRDLLGAVEDLTGPLAGMHHRMPARGAAASPAVLLAAAKLRWLRNAAVDVERWAQAMGRMRWLASESGQAALQSRLDPTFVPRAPWADIVNGAAR